MNLKVLFIILIYYSVITLTFALTDTTFTEENDFNTSVELNNTGLTDDEIDTGGLFSVGVSFTRFFAFVGFGIGLPDDTPTWFQVIYSAWSTLVLIFSVGFVISSIWDG